MICEYHCSSCKLAFSFGRYHLHTLKSGYSASTLLFCKDCGVLYKYMHAIPESGKKDYLRAQPEPITKLHVDLEGIYSVLKEWIPCPNEESYVLESEQKKSKKRMKAIHSPLVTQAVCHYCGSKGSLMDDYYPKHVQCPRCKGTSFEDIICRST